MSADVGATEQTPLVPGRRPEPAPPPRWIGILVAAIGIGGGAVTAATTPTLYGVWVPLALAAGAAVALCVPLALYRPIPAGIVLLVTTWGVSGLSDVDARMLPWPMPVVLLVVSAVVLLIVAVRRRWPLAVGLAVTLVSGTAVIALTDPTVAAWANVVISASVLTVVVAFAILVGLWLGSAERAAAEEERAVREAGLRRVVEERTRIARELHDVVAHGLTIISIQASTVRYRMADVPPPVLQELDQITDAAREALVEMRSLLTVLRADGTTADTAPQPTLDRVGDLVEATRRTGRVVGFEVVGDLSADVLHTSSVAAYRIAQEALSNAARHAPDQPITASVTVDDDRVRLQVVNPLAPSAPARPTGTSTTTPRSGLPGLGLIGMRERAAAAGGTVSAQRSGDRFEVVAEFPRTGDPLSSPPAAPLPLSPLDPGS